MNREDDITPAQRELLGPRQADELARDERWLNGLPIAPPLPSGLHARLMSAVRGELARPRRASRSWRWARVAAAAVVLAGLGLLFTRSMFHRDGGPQPPLTKAGDARAVAAAQRAIDEYLRPVDPGDVQLHFELKRIDQAMASCDGADNPWASLASAIEER